jgi:hypothetical protein
MTFKGSHLLSGPCLSEADLSENPKSLQNGGQNWRFLGQKGGLGVNFIPTMIKSSTLEPKDTYECTFRTFRFIGLCGAEVEQPPKNKKIKKIPGVSHFTYMSGRDPLGDFHENWFRGSCP